MMPYLCCGSVDKVQLVPSLKLQPEEGRPSLQISQFKTLAHCDLRPLELKTIHKPAFWRYVEIATPRIPHYYGPWELWVFNPKRQAAHA